MLEAHSSWFHSLFFFAVVLFFYFTVSWYKGQQRHFDLMHWRNEATLVEYQPIQGTQQLRSFFFVCSAGAEGRVTSLTAAPIKI